MQHTSFSPLYGQGRPESQLGAKFEQISFDPEKPLIKSIGISKNTFAHTLRFLHNCQPPKSLSAQIHRASWLQRYETSAAECQKQCQKTSWCATFVYDSLSKGCNLQALTKKIGDIDDTRQTKREVRWAADRQANV